MNKKATLAALLAIAALAATAGFIYLTDEPVLHGSVIHPPLEAAEIKLTDFNGLPFALSDQRGKVALIYFGYTKCPDECPLTMAKLKLAMQQLGADAAQTSVLLVTTDPERDSPEALKDFLGRFDSAFLGLRGDADQLSKVWRDYGVTVMDGGESHSNYIYVIDTAGYLVETLLPEAVPADIAADVRLLLEAE